MMMLVYDASEVHKEERPLTLALSTYSGAKVMLTNTKTDRSDLLKRTADYIRNHKASVVYSDDPNIVQGWYSIVLFEALVCLSAVFNRMLK